MNTPGARRAPAWGICVMRFSLIPALVGAVSATGAWAGPPAAPLAANAAAADLELGHFGAVIARSGDVLVVASNRHVDGVDFPDQRVDVLVRNPQGEYQNVQTLAGPESTSGFGFALAVSGSTIFVGAPADDNAGGVAAGAVYQFDPDPMNATHWVETQKLLATTPAPGAEFGYSLVAGASELIVGAPVATSCDELSPVSGSVESFRPDPMSGQWASDGALRLNDDPLCDGFGASLALSGNWLAVSGFSTGGVELYDRVDSSGAGTASALVPFPPTGGMALDGDVLAVGRVPMPGTGFQKFGEVRIYEFDGAIWAFSKSLEGESGSDIEDAPRYGTSVSLSGDRLAVGQGPRVIGGCLNARQFVYDRDFGGTGNWGAYYLSSGSGVTDTEECGLADVVVDLGAADLLVGKTYDTTLGTDAGTVEVRAAALNYARVDKLYAVEPNVFANGFE